MRIEGEGRSGNLEDRRGDSGGGGFGTGGGGFRGGGRLGIGGIVVLLILSAIFKTDLLSLAGGGGSVEPAPSSREAPINDPREEPTVRLVSRVLDSTQVMWRQLVPRMGGQWRDAKLVLYRDATETACGYGESATGPFYCPGDQKVYLDLSFYDELKARFQAPGDFAQAYVLAHEIGHHVQNLLGVSSQVHQAQQQGGANGNALSVRLELQADCYAGVWGARAAKVGMLDPGDIDEGLAAAAAVGDDRLQKAATGRVSPESWTHGSSAQRMEWFKRGFNSGDPSSCDTFSR